MLPRLRKVFAATVEPASMQTVYGETHRQRVMERVLKMCCRVLPVYAFFAAVIANSGPEIKNRCTEVSEMTGCAAVIANSGPEIKNRCTKVPEMTGCAAVIANSGLKIKNRCTEVPEMTGCAAVIANSWLEIKNRCTKIPEMIGCAAVIANSGLKIKNRCSTIVSQKRMARLRSRCRYVAASDSNFRCRKVD